MKCVVVGLGEFGRAAALELARNGVDVIAIDANLEPVEAIRNDVSLAIQMDAANEPLMEAHGLGDADVLVAGIGTDFEAQVLVVVCAKKLGIKTVVAKATTPTHARILGLVGADVVLNPEEEAANKLVQRLLIPNISSYFALAEGFSIVEITAPKGTVGKTLQELNLRRRFRVSIVAVKRQEATEGGQKPRQRFNPVPSPEERIQHDDVLALVGNDLDLAAFMAEFA
jgi:trk system potassium uptake protein TrkA